MKSALDFLKETNDFLEQIPKVVPKFFDNVFRSGEDIAQSSVDMICIWIAWKVNIAVERRRQAILRALYDQNSVVNKILAPMRAFKEALTNPLKFLGAVVRVVKSILGVFTKPFEILINFIIDLARELERLAVNLTNIAEIIPPDPPNPHINFNAFKLDISPVKLEDVLSDPNNLPAPEEIFPEPPKPFVSKEYWDTVRDSAKFKEDEPLYSPGKKSNVIREYSIHDGIIPDYKDVPFRDGEAIPPVIRVPEID